MPPDSSYSLARQMAPGSGLALDPRNYLVLVLANQLAEHWVQLFVFQVIWLIHSESAELGRE